MTAVAEEIDATSSELTSADVSRVSLRTACNTALGTVMATSEVASPSLFNATDVAVFAAPRIARQRNG